MSFKSVQKKIAKSGHSMESAGAILAAASRHASPAAKRANPNLKKVKGRMHEGGTIPESGAYEMQKGEVVIPVMHKEKNDTGPKGSEERAGMETVSSTPNKGCCCESQPVVDAGHDSGTGHWEGQHTDVKFVS